MSWGTCYSGSNNIHFDSPPIMADGRNYASWQPEAVVNERIQKQENIKTNWDYRQYMTNNGLTIMKYNNSEACYQLGISANSDSNDTTPSDVPYLFNSTFSSGKPAFGYRNSDLKQPYMSRQQLQARMISPTINMSNHV